MPRRRTTPESERVEELLQKLLVVQMFSMGATQEKIAKVVGRQKQCVNDILKGMPRKAVDGDAVGSKR